MNQITKTGIFAGVAVVAVVLAVVASMPRRFDNVGDDATELLFRDFQDPSAAQSMRIVKYDEDTGTQHEFQVARVKDEQGRDLWRIASHHNYPADANTQLAGAASALLNKQRGVQLSSNRSQHGTTYGVLDPSEEGNAGERGRGTLVVFEGESEKKLAELIVGKPVKDKPSHRYVRLRGQDHVYQVEMDADKFSTKFDDWIERDLLKLDAWRIKEVVIQDLDLGPNRRVQVKGVLELKYDGSAGENRWELTGANGLTADEKLEDAKLNDLRSALDELKIVDVNRKLPALAALLGGKDDRQHDPAEMQFVQASLQAHGFLVGSQGIVPSDGVVIVQMEDGLLYTLYFGGLAEQTADQNEERRKKGEKEENGEKKEDESGDAKKDDAKAAGEKKKAAGSNRYVFVTAHLNKDFVKKPEIKPLPGEPLLPVGNASEKAVKEDKTEADAPEAKAKPAAKPQKVALADSVRELRRLQDEGLMDQAEFDHQRKQAEDANRRAQEQYDKDLETAAKREKELNERFADWYYVIDDEVYRKIRLKRADIVKGPEKPKDEAGKEKGKSETEGGAGAKANKASGTKTP